MAAPKENQPEGPANPGQGDHPAHPPHPPHPAHPPGPVNPPRPPKPRDVGSVGRNTGRIRSDPSRSATPPTLRRAARPLWRRTPEGP